MKRFKILEFHVVCIQIIVIFCAIFVAVFIRVDIQKFSISGTSIIRNNQKTSEMFTNVICMLVIMVKCRYVESNNKLICNKFLFHQMRKNIFR